MKTKKKAYHIVVEIQCSAVCDINRSDQILTSLGKRYKMKEIGSGFAIDTNTRDFSYEVKTTENAVLRKIKGICKYMSRYKRSEVYLYDYTIAAYHVWKITSKKTTYKKVDNNH